MTDQEYQRLEALLRVPSVSAMPEHAPDMATAAGMIADEIRRAGGEAEIRETPRHPLVLGEVPASPGFPDAPRVLLYGHYDVQPPGDPELWTSPAFEPTIRDGNLYARGASDDKGNLFMLVTAVQRLAAAGELPVRAAFVIEGEEESGGTSALEHFAGDPGPAIGAVIFDSHMIGPGQPTICTGVRGMVFRRIHVRTAGVDGHSGLYGGAALNAAHALMRILAAVTPHDGRLPDALYAGVAPAGAEEVTAWDLLPSGAEALADGGAAARRPRRGRGLLHADAGVAVPRRPRPDLRRAVRGEDDRPVGGLGDAVAAAGARAGRRGAGRRARRPAAGGGAPGGRADDRGQGRGEPRGARPDRPGAGGRGRRHRARHRVDAGAGADRRHAAGGGGAGGAGGSRRCSPGSGCRPTGSTPPTSTSAHEHLELGTRAAMEILRALGGIREPAPR